MVERNSDPGWSLEDERALGDSLQEIIRQDTTEPEDDTARQVARNAADVWRGYSPGDEE